MNAAAVFFASDRRQRAAAASLRADLAVLAAALRGPADAPALDALDPEEFHEFARRHAVSEILAALLETSPVRDRLPASILQPLTAARRAQAARSERLLGALARVAGALGVAGVGCILLKGLGLAARAYGGVDRRAARDLDLLVGHEDVPRAERVLAGIGFSRVSWAPLRGLAMRFAHAFDYAAGDIALDLHWTLARHPSFRFDLEGFRGRRRSIELGAVRIDVPADEDALAFLLVSAFRDLQRGALRARTLADIHRLASICGPGLDWDAFLERRRAEGTYAIAVNVLALLLDVLEARAALPFVASAVDRARTAVRLDAEGHLRLLDPPPGAIQNRLWALRLYDVSPARSALFWLVSLPFRILVYRVSARRARGSKPRAGAGLRAGIRRAAAGGP